MVLNMRKVNLKMDLEQIVTYVKDFVDHKLKNFKHLAGKIGCSLKTAYNYVHGYKAEGKAFFVHGNSNKKPVTTISSEIKEQIIDIYNLISPNGDVNFSHFLNILKRDYNIVVSYTFLYKLLSSDSKLSPKCNKATRTKRNKTIQDKINNNIPLTKTEQAIVADGLLDSKVAHPRKERARYFGELIQMDASQHRWFGNIKTYLHAAIDDSTGKIVGAYFDTQETLDGYYNITKQFLTKYGIPAIILTDNRTVFNYIKEGKNSEERDTFTQYGFMCFRLGIDLRTSSIPQVKGRIERLFETLQSRLTVEMRLHSVETIEQANEFLLKYIDEYNSYRSLPVNNTTNGFEKLKKDFEIDKYLARCSHRKTDNGGCIKYNNKYYKFISESGVQVTPRSKQDCLVVKKFDGTLIGMLNENSYHLEECKEHKTTSFFDVEKTKEKRKYIPAWNHPWRKKFYDEYIKFYRPNLQNNFAYK